MNSILGKTLQAFALACVCMPTLCMAQGTGRIECARNDGYVYLYSSVLTLEVRATLQCGETVQITGRDQSYIQVRTAKGDVGFVPVNSLQVLKDQVGTGLPAGAATPPRERIHYDNGPNANEKAAANHVGFGLAEDTEIKVKLKKTLSSATAQLGETVELEVLQDVTVDGVVVIRKGALATGVIAEVELKKRFGHSGHLGFNITSVRMENGESLPVRGYESASGAPATGSQAVLPLSSGKDASIPQDTEFTVKVLNDTPLKRESFAAR